MFTPRHGSIRSQLQTLAALSAAAALLVACAAFVLNDMRIMSMNKRQQLYRDAAVVGRNAGAELAKRDLVAAESQLSTLRLEPTITAACLYDAAGEVVATYSRDLTLIDEFPQPDAEAWLREWNDDELALFQPIYRKSQRVGSLFLRCTRDDIQQQQAAYPLIVGVVFLISLSVAGAFASRLQSRVSTPIEALARAAELITKEGDYSVRVHQKASGQIGDLCSAFNAMLDRIETTDSSLQTARDELNARVRERTRELHREVLERRYAESIASGQKRVLQQLATGQPLNDVLMSLVGEIESHVRNSHAAISLVEPNAEWFGDPIGLQLGSLQRDGLSQLPLSSSGTAPARAAATLTIQQDRHKGNHATDASGFQSTAHGGACWAVPVATPDARLLAVITLFHRHDRLPNEDECELLQSACSLASLAIEQRNGEEALKAAMRKATAANRAKSDFLANMSHEIRTPLNAILGFGDLLLGEASQLTPEQRSYLDTIASSGKHLLALINDILDLSKIESSEMAVSLQPADPNRVLVEVMSLLRVRAVEKEIALDCAWDTPAPATIETDSARLRQLLLNLVGNAVKFTDAGSVRVTSAIERPEADDPQLRIEIKDTGIGIPADKLDEVFKPFVQADASVTRRFGGTGLGLAICRRLAEAMGGDLNVTSNLGEGSCFTLRLPTGSLAGIEAGKPPVCDGLHARSTDVTQGIEREVSLDGLRVLVVDDGETNRRLISLVLRRAGATVELAENGQEGFDAATACGFDVILMDMQMPVMDGYTAARKLRASGYTEPIIALTAHAMKGDQQRCLDAGCSDYLAKPIESPRLLAKLGEYGDSAVVQEQLPGPTIEESGSAPLIASTLPTEDEEFREVVEEFLKKSASEIVAMVALADAEDWSALTEKAHWLKGSGGTAGFEVLSSSARELESLLEESPDAERVRRSLQELNDLQNRLVVSPEPTHA